MLVPKLRFKEFNGEWNKIDFNENFNFYNTNSLTRDDLCDTGVIKNIHYGDIHQRFNNIVDISNTILPYIKENINISISENSYCQNGDLIFADASEDYLGIGKAVELINIKNDKIVSGLHTILLRENKKQMDIGFKGYLFNTAHIHNQIRILANGFKVFGISKSNIIKLDVYVPSYNEQEKITNLLVLLDKNIELQNRRIQALKMYKKGLIQNLYNVEYNKIEKLNHIIKEKSIRNSDNNIKQVYSVSNKEGFILQSEQFKDRTVASEDTSNYKIVKKDYFAYNPARINVGSIARMKKDTEGIISPMYICFECNKEVLPNYLEEFFKSQEFIHEMNKRLEGSVRMCLSYESMRNIPINIPNIEKQKQISLILNELSKKINIEEKKYSYYNRLKKGLLQKMFI